MAMYTPGTYTITVVTRNGRRTVSTKTVTLTVRKSTTDTDLKAMAARRITPVFGYRMTTAYTITRA